MPKLTVIFAYRNRDTVRVKRCLDSLAIQTYDDFEILFVDYGSDAPIASEMEKLINTYPKANYHYTDTRGFPWNRSRALNVGIQQSQSDYILTTDVDMIYPTDFLEKMMCDVQEDEVRHVYHYFLPKNYADWKNLKSYNKDPADKSVLGACHLVHKKHMNKLRAFDEFFCFWGVEDRDLNLREKALGLSVRWMNDKTYMHHQWHATANYATPGFMPEGWWFKMENYFLQNQKHLQRNPNGWGVKIPTKERAIFSFIDFEKKELIQKEIIKVLDLKPFQSRSLTTFMNEWTKLPNGHVLLLKNAFYPFTNKIPRLLARLKEANKLTKYLLYDVDVSKNILHGMIYQFCEEHKEEVKDYYIGLPFENGLTLVLKR